MSDQLVTLFKLHSIVEVMTLNNLQTFCMNIAKQEEYLLFYIHAIRLQMWAH